MNKKKLVVLTGAGISAESGIPTFRDAAEGLWENFDINTVCTANAIRVNPEHVHNFYNMLRKKYAESKPNEAHKILAELEKDFDVCIITQNVDNLHEAAGSTNVLHLHGEIMKCRSVNNTQKIYDIPVDENGEYNTNPDMIIDGEEIRPHIVFFNEDVPNITKAQEIMKEADICLVIGTSFVVYPAAGLVDYVEYGNPIYYIDPDPKTDVNTYSDIKIIKKKATDGMREMREILKTL